MNDRVSPSDTLKFAPAGDVTPCHCITCSDEGVEMTIVAIDAERGLALCQDSDGERQSVETALVEPVAVGDTLLVHAGTALTALQGQPA